jgi:phosphonate degradation associated HDIG domain protein
MTDPLRQELLDIFVGRATRRYGLSAINQLQHALQAAALAEADDAPPATVLASLLHDVGHMIHHLGEDPAGRGIDDVHEELGARWLADRFGPEVSEPVRLHVAAKRYLCAVEADYFGKLSPDSVRSLGLQGGPMSADEVEQFQRLPLYAEAVRLRRFDEAAKDPLATTPDFDHFLRHVAVCRRA